MRIRALLSEEVDVEVVGEGTDGREAVSLVRESSPDVLLLDVQMPRGSGFDVLDRLGEARPPVIIFTTAHSEFGARAFDFSATDYLVKPFDRQRVRQALDRARRRLAGEPAERGAVSRAAWKDRFAVRVRGRIIFVRTSEIVWIGAEGNYVRLHTATGSYLERDSMKHLESSLDPSSFLRVHRSAIVSVEHIVSIDSTSDGSLQIQMSSGERVPLGPNYRKNLQDLAGTRF